MDNKVLLRLREIVVNQSWNYRLAGPNSSEPAAFSCLALCAHGMASEALPMANWLAELQTDKGAVGVSADQATPAWPTSLAILAWLACDNASNTMRFVRQRELALDWSLRTQGKTAPNSPQVGHNTELTGWSWAEATHSWLEPTCMFVLALKALGQTQHARTREGVQIIFDRQLERGGCNYGNTRVLGQATLPHIQPTGLAMLAIADETTDDPRARQSLDYLTRTLDEQTATASLCFGLLGLTAHGKRPSDTDELLEHALHRDDQHDCLSCYNLALLSLAEFSDTSWLPQTAIAPVQHITNA